MNAKSAEPTPTVYVAEHQAYDYTPAEAFGTLHFIEAKPLAPQSPSAPDAWNKGVVHQIRKVLTNYLPGFDFIIPTGSPSRMLLVGMLLAERGKKHNILKWDGRTQRYLQYNVTL